MTTPMHTARCLCGAVSVDVPQELPEPMACHCSMCRRHSGHVLAATEVPKSAITVHGDEHVRWYASSPKVRRGFCGTCGSTLFFDPIHLDWIAIMMGLFDNPTGTRLKRHIFVGDKGDYYDIADAVPQREN